MIVKFEETTTTYALCMFVENHIFVVCSPKITQDKFLKSSKTDRCRHPSSCSIIHWVRICFLKPLFIFCSMSNLTNFLSGDFYGFCDWIIIIFFDREIHFKIEYISNLRKDSVSTYYSTSKVGSFSVSRTFYGKLFQFLFKRMRYTYSPSFTPSRRLHPTKIRCLLYANAG